eukprot:8449661-Alexandrium_andersonii.AAC.1
MCIRDSRLGVPEHGRGVAIEDTLLELLEEPPAPRVERTAPELLHLRLGRPPVPVLVAPDG